MSRRSPTARKRDGDLSGALDRLDYLASLGIDLVWLAPFYLSPLVDHGYDVADPCRVYARFGDLEVLTRWWTSAGTEGAEPVSAPPSPRNRNGTVAFRIWLRYCAYRRN
jgi:hypothetical protein